MKLSLTNSQGRPDRQLAKLHLNWIHSIIRCAENGLPISYFQSCTADNLVIANGIFSYTGQKEKRNNV